jgi:hypothetical protein
MRIEIEQQIDAETKEVYSFNLIDTTAVFIGWNKQVKPKGKRVWKTEFWWDRYNLRSCNANEPELPEIIRSQALDKVIERCRVKTWAEWKSN